MRALHLSLFAAVALAPHVALAQTSKPSSTSSIIRNGSFERIRQVTNQLFGTDREGNLSGYTYKAPALDAKGSISEISMPISVAVGDLNGDGLLDIASSDPLGYIRVYFNSGTKVAPAFTQGELTLPFLAISEGDPPWPMPDRGGWRNRRKVVKISLADTSRSGKLDIIAGNYFGELFLIRNNGSASAPRFEQPQPLNKAMIQTSKDPTRRWGNIFAPIMHDWDGDGRLDLLVGEGSFSANSVHLFLNKGSANAPSFTEDQRQTLALGQGREQLNPTMADFNGDGRLDILVADNVGNITVYLWSSNWKAGDTIAPSGYLAKDGGLTQNNPDDPAQGKAQALVLGNGIHTISAGDLNGDGLFDLVVGKNNGRIAWSPNIGTKEAPKFNPPKDITGQKPTPASWMVPSQWDIDLGVERGNFFAFATAVTEADDPGASPQEGTRALKFGYAKSANTILPRPDLNLAASRTFSNEGRGASGNVLYTASAADRANGGASHFFAMRQSDFTLQIGKTYTLTLKVRGAKVANANIMFGWRGAKTLEQGRTVVGERGATRTVGAKALSDSTEILIPFNPTSTWSTIKRTFKVEFLKEKELNKEEKTSHAVIDISFELSSPDGFLYIDDIQLTTDQ